MNRPPLTWLYAPASRPELAAKAIAGDADVAVLDLEDAVAPDLKPAARQALGELLALAGDRAVQVRVNAPDTPWFAADLAALAGCPVELRIPKVESADQVRMLVARVRAQGLTGRLHCLLESALGVENAFAVAAADPAVASVGLGEADLRSALGVGDEAGLDWARGRLVVASRAAGLGAPALSVYPRLRDDEGLAASCRRGRELGFLGRAAIHPAQLPVIRAAFTPSAAEVEQAAELLAGLDGAVAAGTGALVLSDGRFVDRAMVGAARTVLALADPVRDH